MPFDRTAFLRGYLSLILQTSADPTYIQYVRNHPHNALREHGIEVSHDARIEVILLSDARQGRIEQQIDYWEQGQHTGIYQLMLVTKESAPNTETAKLSDEDLDAVNGGTLWHLLQDGRSYVSV